MLNVLEILTNEITTGKIELVRGQHGELTTKRGKGQKEHKTGNWILQIISKRSDKDGNTEGDNQERKDGTERGEREEVARGEEDAGGDDGSVRTGKECISTEKGAEGSRSN